ncbi:hypothetical protein EfmAA96_23290 [Enterococcus faecium]|nr:hypothetical protein EfmAA96_23290 [Enterococcus faecium]
MSNPAGFSGFHRNPFSRFLVQAQKKIGANPEEVKFLVTDMNAAYFQLTKRILPNAKVVIDRFHIIKHMNQAFNELRTKVTVPLRYFPSIHPSPRFYPKQRSSFQENLEKNHLSANFPMH